MAQKYKQAVRLQHCHLACNLVATSQFCDLTEKETQSFFFFFILERREILEVLNAWISISNREGISTDCCLLEVEVYSPFLDLVTASWWEAGTCGRSPSVLWIYWEEERNILWGQLGYVPVLLQASPHYCLWKYILCIPVQNRKITCKVMQISTGKHKTTLKLIPLLNRFVKQHY